MSIRDDVLADILADHHRMLLGWDVVVDGGESISAVVKSLTTEEVVAIGFDGVFIVRTTKRRLAVKNVVQQTHQFFWYSDKKPDDIKDYDAFIAMNPRLQGNIFHGADHYHAVSVDPVWNRHMKI